MLPARLRRPGFPCPVSLLGSPGLLARLPHGAPGAAELAGLLPDPRQEPLPASPAGLILVELCYRLIAADQGGSGRRSHPSAAAGADRT